MRADPATDQTNFDLKNKSYTELTSFDFENVYSKILLSPHIPGIKKY